MQQNVHEFTGTAGANWTSFQIPGQLSLKAVMIMQAMHVPKIEENSFVTLGLFIIYCKLFMIGFDYTGDVVYFEFTVNSGGGNTSWGYKFTVTAGTRDSFQTGYVILSNVLSTDLAL
jgi:hypothetical protein